MSLTITLFKISQRHDKQIVLFSGYGGASGELLMSLGYCLLIFLKLQSKCMGE